MYISYLLITLLSLLKVILSLLKVIFNNMEFRLYIFIKHKAVYCLHIINWEFGSYEIGIDNISQYVILNLH